MHFGQREEQKNVGAHGLSAGKKLTEGQFAFSAAETLRQLIEQMEIMKPALQTSNDELSILQNNITEIKKVAAISLEEQKFFQTIYENSFVGMATMDLKGRFIHINGAMCDITGYSEAELVEKPYALIIHSDDGKIFDEAWKSLLKSTSKEIVIEVRYNTKSTETIWVRTSVSLLKDGSGNAKSMLLMCIDIEEGKKAQQKAEEVTKHFRFLADSMPQQIWTADVRGKLDYFSHAFYEALGIKYGDIENGSWDIIVHSEDREKTNSLWMESLETGSEFVVEHRLKRRDGNYKWQLSRAMPQRDNHGKIVMWVGATTNIHDHKIHEEQLEKQVVERTQDLREANFNLKHSNHDLEQFAYIATHDLQEPLRKIRTYSSWINKEFKHLLPEDAQDYMNKIENASERMAKLIDDLLNYSLLLRPQELFEFTDLNYIVNEILEDFSSLIKRKQVIIQKMQLPVMKVVPMQMQQLFYNLVSNALKFTWEGRQPEIHITSRLVPVEEIIDLHLDIDVTYVEIAVIDNGIGFKQEYAEKIFTIFQRLNNRKDYPGTGIGLALCQKIVFYHHGFIYVKARENLGASFYVLLPISNTE